METFPSITCLCLCFFLFRDGVAYIPNICSGNGGICVDEEANLALNNGMEVFTNFVLNPHSLFEWCFDLFERFVNAFKEEPKQECIFKEIYTNVLEYFGYKEEVKSSGIENYICNSAAFCVIVMSYFCYVFVTSRYYKSRQRDLNFPPFVCEDMDNDFESEYSAFLNNDEFTCKHCSCSLRSPEKE